MHKSQWQQVCAQAYELICEVANIQQCVIHYYVNLTVCGRVCVLLSGAGGFM